MGRKQNYHRIKYILDFIRDFSILCEEQLKDLTNILKNSVTDIMDSITNINSISDLKKKQSDEVIVSTGSTGDGTATDSKGAGSKFKITSFEALSQAEKEKIENEETDKVKVKIEIMEKELMRASGKFSKQIEAVSTMEEDVRELLFFIMGAASINDVIEQRINHMIFSFKKFNELLVTIINDMEDRITIDDIKLFRNKILTSVYLSYTTEDERKIFHKIFGLPVKKRQEGKSA